MRRRHALHQRSPIIIQLRRVSSERGKTYLCFLEFGPRLRIDCISVLFRVCKHLNSPLTGENESFGSVRHFHSCMSPRFTPFTSVMVTFLSRVCDNFLSHHGLTAQSWQNKLFPNSCSVPGHPAGQLELERLRLGCRYELSVLASPGFYCIPSAPVWSRVERTTDIRCGVRLASFQVPTRWSGEEKSFTLQGVVEFESQAESAKCWRFVLDGPGPCTAPLAVRPGRDHRRAAAAEPRP